MRGKKIILYGCGAVGRMMVNELRRFDIPVECFCGEETSGHEYCGCIVKSVDEVKKHYKKGNYTILLCLAPADAAKAKSELIRGGVFDKSDFCKDSLNVLIAKRFPSAKLIRPYAGRITEDPPPPNTIPPEYKDRFTLSGRIPVYYLYFDERRDVKCLNGEYDSVSLAVHNTEQKYAGVFKALAERKFQYYGKEVDAFYDALEKYPLDGKDVLIWGLAGCNCDAIALYYNAKRVYVVDYNKPICDHKRVEVMSHEELRTNGVKADAAFSYSSFEHDGLGRYGDPIDPDGDLKAMRDVWKRLKDGGVLFLGVPIGKDCLYWNANRGYGPYRLPKLLRGFQLIDAYNVYGDVIDVCGEGGGYPFDMSSGRLIQCLLVCRKISADYPEDSVLMHKKEKSGGVTNAPVIMNNINKAVLEYKNGVA